MEKRIDDLEQYSRMDDLLISGLKTKPVSYARAAANSVGDGVEETPSTTKAEQASLENQVLKFFEERNIQVRANLISACHVLPRRDGNTNNTPLIIMRFANRKAKVELMTQRTKLDGTDVFFNEHLTKRNAEIAREARILKKNGKIEGTWTRNCKVWIKLNGAPENAKPTLVKDKSELDKYR